MKLEPMAHQVEAHQLQVGREHYALFCEQGTGKTYMLAADFERDFINGEIDGVLVLAPRGVHSNWIRRELPKMLDVEWIGCAYKPGVKYVQNQFKELMHSSRLAIFTINLEAAVTKVGYKMCLEFLRGKKVYMILDESHRVKNPQAARTKQILTLAPFAVKRRISTGTATPNSPPDLFTQFQFLAPGVPLLGTNSYRSFVARYTKLLPQDSALVRHIKSQTKKKIEPQIPQTDNDGNPIYQNLDALQELISPLSFRVLKKDCLDLPQKIYKEMEFELTPSLRRHYTTLKEELLIELDPDNPEAVKNVGQKLQQVTSGFILIEGQPQHLGDNPRLDALKEVVMDTEGQFIVWAKFKEEIKMISYMFSEMGIEHGLYYGDVSEKIRDEVVDKFQAGELRAIVGNAAAGGVGLTLTAASSAIYYSNTFKWDDREQSEDRCHRIGTTGDHVLYTDLVAIDTLDQRILSALLNKTSMSAAIMGELTGED